MNPSTNLRLINLLQIKKYLFHYPPICDMIALDDKSGKVGLKLWV